MSPPPDTEASEASKVAKDVSVVAIATIIAIIIVVVVSVSLLVKFLHGVVDAAAPDRRVPRLARAGLPQR